MRGTLRQITLGALLYALFCVVLGVGSPAIEGRVGLAQRVVAGRYAPITVDVSGLSFPVTGELRVVQRVGNAWRGEASATIVLASGVITNGAYSGVIPVYEPANPLSIHLVDSNGSPTVEADLILRDAQQPALFPLSVGRTPLDAATEAWIPASDLPSDWAGLDSVSVLWIGAAPSRAAWEAIATWVLAGGSVVIGTGSDFFRIDTPLVRDLLPVEAPQLVLIDGAPARLEGQLKSGATPLTGQDGRTVALSHRYGAGHVTMLSKRLSDLSRDEVATLAAVVETASIVNLDAVGQAMFERLDISRPQMGAAALLAVTATVLFTGLVTVGRKLPRVGISGILVGSMVLSVLSGLYINRTKPTLAAYVVSTHLRVRAAVGYEGVSSVFVTMHPSPLRVQGLGSSRVRMDYTPDPQRPNYDSFMTSNSAILSLPPGQRGGYSAIGASSRAIDFQIDPVTPGKVSVTSWLSVACDGVLLVDGVAYRLESIEPGVHQYSLPPGESIESPLGMDASFSDLYQQFLEDFALGDAPWMLVLCETSIPADRDDALPQTRLVTLHAQRGGAND